MTVSNHTALYKFTFPANSTPLSPLILVDLTDLPKSRSNGAASVDPSTGRLTGNGTFNPSFGIGNYNLHFCVDFKGAEVRDTGVFTDGSVDTNSTTVSAPSDSSVSVGAFARFHAPADNTITARVGVSFISAEKACDNAEKEIPDFDFVSTVTNAEEAWKAKLDVIDVNADGVSTDLQKTFWSGVYRTMISPQDYTGENPLWSSDEPYYDSYYWLVLLILIAAADSRLTLRYLISIWDSFRSIHPLLTIIDPVSQSRMIRSLIDIYRHEGYLPDCRMSLCKGYTQGGSNADVVIADSFLKSVPGDIDWATAYEAVVKDAEIEPSNWDVEGRGGLVSWKTLGYIPINDIDTLGTGLHTRSISRTVEYAYNDFWIAEMAKSLGHDADYEKYIKRASNWVNLYKQDQNSSINGVDTGFTGFLQPRNINGTWGYQDPVFCSPLLNFDSCYLNANGHETYEGSCWLYTLYVLFI